MSLEIDLMYIRLPEDYYEMNEDDLLIYTSLKIFEPEYQDLWNENEEVICDRPREPALSRCCPGSFDLVEPTSKEEVIFYFKKKIADGVSPEKVEREKKEFFEIFGDYYKE